MIRRIYILTLFCCAALVNFAADFNVLDFGAVKNQVSTPGIQRAIDTCFALGGGRVVIPSGRFISGVLMLKSRVELHLVSGAVLEASLHLEDYKIDGRSYGMIYCEEAIQVSITGSGTIKANGILFYETDKNHVFPEFDRKQIRQKDQYMPEGIFTPDGPLKRKPRPGMTLVFFHCTDVKLTGITIEDTPVWAIRFGYCEGVLVDGITILNNPLIPNSDGIHCSASRNIRITNCNIVAGDDAIIMTGFDKIENVPDYNTAEQASHQYGNKSIYAENISVTNCQLKSTSAGIRIGYGQHPIRRGIFSNIIIYDSHRGIGIFAHDKSDIEDLIFSDIIIESRLYNGQWWGNGEPIHLSCISRFEGVKAGQIKNVQFNNITATGEQGILVYGLKESQLENIQFNNVQLRLKKGKETLTYGGNFDVRPATPPHRQLFEHDIPGLYAQHVKGLSIRNFNLQWGDDLPSFFTHGIQCEEVTDLYIDAFNGGPNPKAAGSQKVFLTNTKYRK
ncbi:MAG: glycosyl hydrolase family 28 protein [Saprospiraceae bacterium]|nr:glycosyl hydrolase family 28 protein [Saprospiraceae bacterium]